MTKESLHGFCKRFDLSKSTVHRRCRLLGIDTSDGLTADAVDQLIQEFDLESPPVVEGEIIEPSMPAGSVALTRNSGVPPIPQFGTGRGGEVRDLSRVRYRQGTQNLETYFNGMAANYLHYKTEELFASIDAAVANTAQGLAHQAHNAVTGEGDENLLGKS